MGGRRGLERDQVLLIRVPDPPPEAAQHGENSKPCAKCWHGVGRFATKCTAFTNGRRNRTSLHLYRLLPHRPPLPDRCKNQYAIDFDGFILSGFMPALALPIAFH